MSLQSVPGVIVPEYPYPSRSGCIVNWEFNELDRTNIQNPFGSTILYSQAQANDHFDLSISASGVVTDKFLNYQIFDGVDDFAETVNRDPWLYFGIRDFTLEFWVRFPSGSDGGMLFWYGDEDDYEGGFLWKMTDSGTVIQYHDYGGEQVVVNDKLYVNDMWMHLVWSAKTNESDFTQQWLISSNKWHDYYNAPFNYWPMQYNSPIFLMGDYFSQYPVKCDLSVCRIYDYAMDIDEIQRNYEAERWRYEG